MEEPKKRRPSKKQKSKRQADEDQISELAGCVMEALSAESQLVDEPFERYTLDLRLRIHKNVQTSRDRFVEGYKALLGQLGGPH